MLPSPRLETLRRIQQLLIKSSTQPLVKLAASLRDRRARERTGCFYAEGTRFVAEAIACRAGIVSLITAPPLITNSIGKRLVAQARYGEVPVREVSPETYGRISQAGDRQGIAAILRQRWEPLDALRVCETPVWLAVGTVGSHGNLGTIVRTAEAVGAAGLIFLGGATDPYDPAAVRASMGAIFGLRYVRIGVAAFAHWRTRSGFQVVGTSPHADCEYRSVGYTGPTVLFLGCERGGMSPDQVAVCDTMVRIPMIGRADSLNLGVAAGVLLYEVFSQRHPIVRS
jgi:TrmH family RNA methyltransferase